MNALIEFINTNTWLIVVVVIVATVIAGAVYEFLDLRRKGYFNRVEGRLLYRGQCELLDALEWRDLEKETDPMALFFDVLVRMEAGVRHELEFLSTVERLQAQAGMIIDRHGYADAGIDEIDRQLAYQAHDELSLRGFELPHPETCLLKRQCEDLTDQRVLASQRLRASELASGDTGNQEFRLAN